MSDLEDHNQLFDLIGKMLEYDPAGLTFKSLEIKEYFVLFFNKLAKSWVTIKMV